MADPEKPLTAEEISKLEVKNEENISKKYDRQIRLWGLNGQERLGNCHVLLLGAGPAGSETLKNLVLPGIGKFSIVDGEKVSNRDLGNNFFVELAGVGQSRAEEVGRLIQELNGFVEKGHIIEHDPVHWVNTVSGDVFRDFDVIIANNLPDATILKLGELSEHWNKKLVVLRTNGLIGTVRLYAKEHKVLESKPDGEKWDLRIQGPWPALQAYADSFDTEAMKADLQQFSPDFTHVPFTVLLIKLLTKWKSEHGGNGPSSDVEKKEFGNLIISYGRGFSTAENFKEAINNKYLVWKEYEIPPDTQAIFDDDRCIDINEQSPRFWLLARAVKEFVANEGHGVLPLVGQLPDMTAKPAAYIAMQRLYREKAEEDWRAVKVHLQGFLKSINKSPDDIPDDLTALFCKHSNVMKVFRFTSLNNEFNKEKINSSNIEWYDTTGVWYIAFRAAGRFQGAHGRLPGDRNDDAHADLEGLQKIAAHLLEDLGMVGDDYADLKLDDHLGELCRFGGSQIHNTCAFIGGVAAQEIIKLVTRQWHPVDNTYIYNGITGTSAFFAV